MEKKTYICIDLKSFYASVECASRKLDPLTTNLVVADLSRTEKTICLAVSPSLKAYGLKGRARLFEVVQKVKEINMERLKNAPNHRFNGKSSDSTMLLNHPELELSYITAVPRMQTYIDVSSTIYSIYLKYIAKEDIHVYSIDEVFMDVTHYLKNYRLTAHELAMKMIQDVLKNTGITATAGIGTNMYLAKVAMDIVAKHIPADKDGVRIAELDEFSYRRKLWSHTPLTDFWRVGHGYEERLNKLGIYTMGDIAKCALGPKDQYYNEDLLYKEFGINAELLIDHAFGYEPTTIKDIKAYKPKANSLSVGQVLHCPYTYDDAKIIVKEMMETLSLQLVEKEVMTDGISLDIGYDIENVNGNTNTDIVEDRFGRKMPKPSHGSIRLDSYTSSTERLVKAITELYERISDPKFSVRRINIVALSILPLDKAIQFNHQPKQLSLFETLDDEESKNKEQEESKEARVQKAMLDIKKRYGKNAVMNGTSYEKSANERERNKQIGGHKA